MNLRFGSAHFLLATAAVFLVTAAGFATANGHVATGITPDAQHELFMEIFELHFDPKSDGTKLTMEEEKKLTKQYAESLNELAFEDANLYHYRFFKIPMNDLGGCAAGSNGRRLFIGSGGSCPGCPPAGNDGDDCSVCFSSGGNNSTDDDDSYGGDGPTITPENTDDDFNDDYYPTNTTEPPGRNLRGRSDDITEEQIRIMPIDSSDAEIMTMQDIILASANANITVHSMEDLYRRAETKVQKLADTITELESDMEAGDDVAEKLQELMAELAEMRQVSEQRKKDLDVARLDASAAAVAAAEAMNDGCSFIVPEMFLEDIERIKARNIALHEENDGM